MIYVTAIFQVDCELPTVILAGFDPVRVLRHGEMALDALVEGRQEEGQTGLYYTLADLFMAPGVGLTVEDVLEIDAYGALVLTSD